MPEELPIKERIARAIQAALQEVTEEKGYAITLAAVERPTSADKWKPDHLAARILQDDPRPLDELEPGTSPALSAWSQPFTIDVAVRQAEAAAEPLDSVLNRVEAELTKALMADPRWGGLAIGSAIEALLYLPSPRATCDGLTIVLAVSYRTRAADPYSKA